MKNITFVFFVIVYFMSAAFADAKMSVGACAEFYNADYKVPYKMSGPKAGIGAFIGNMEPGGWQASFVRTTVNGNSGHQVLSDFLNINENRQSQYAINTLGYQKYFNVGKGTAKIGSLSMQHFLDVGIGGGLTEVRGFSEETYSFSKASPLREVYVDNRSAVDKVGGFGTISVRLGLEASHVGIGLIVNKSFGDKVAGFFSGSSYALNLGLKW